MLEVGGAVKHMGYLSGTQDVGKPELLPRIECTGDDIGYTQDILVKEATSLRDHPTFIITRSKMFFDIVDVSDDVILVNFFCLFIIVIGKYETYFTAVIADGSLRIVLGIQILRELEEQLFC